MGLFNRRKPKTTEITTSRENNYNGNVLLITDLQKQVKEIEDKPSTRDELEEFAKNISNEDLYEPIMTAAVMARDDENGNRILGEEERQEIKDNIANGNYEPTDTFSNGFATEDIKVTKVTPLDSSKATRDENKLNNEEKINGLPNIQREENTIRASAILPLGDEDSVLIKIDINQDTLKTYNNLRGDMDLYSELRKRAYNSYLEKKYSPREANIMAEKRADSMLKGRAIQLQGNAKLSRNRIPKENIQNIFNRLEDIREPQVILRRPEHLIKNRMFGEEPAI